MSGCDCGIEAEAVGERRVLLALLAINALMFLVEIGFGLVSESTALIADSLDMLADAAVYGIALLAVGRARSAKIRAARLSGMLQVLLGGLVLADVLRRTLLGSEPVSLLMIGIGGLALVANLACLALLARHREGGVHMRASWIFSKNDVIANLGVILGGILVLLSGSRFPDLVIGCAIALAVIRGGIHIMRDAAAERRTSMATPDTR